MTAVLVAALLADDNDVTQGPGGTGTFLGFLFTFLLAGALILLALNLTRQLRKVDRNATAAGLTAEPAPDPATSEESRPRGLDSSDVAEGERSEGDERGGRDGAAGGPGGAA